MSSIFRNLGDLVRIRTGKLDANANDPAGLFPFFTCAREPLRIATHSYDCECVLVAGNGDLNVKYYKGKFDAYQRTYIIESLNSEVLDVRYLYHFMDAYLDQLRHMSIGGVIKYIKIGNLTEAELPLPTLADQRRIAAILDQANSLRAKRREALVQLDILVQSIFIEMFGNPINNELNWETSQLEQVCLKITDGTHKTPRYVDSGIPFLSAKDLKGGDIEWETGKFISEEEHGQLIKRCNPELGDILLSKSGSLGAVAIINRDHQFSLFESLCLMKIDRKKIDARFLIGLMRNPEMFSHLLGSTKGIAIKHLHLIDIRSLVIPLPPLSLQCKFGEKMSLIAKVKAMHLEELNVLNSLCSSLQHRAFRGEL